MNGSETGANGSSAAPRLHCIFNDMRQFTVSKKVVLCDSDPDVAVTVMVVVTGCEPPPPPPLAEAPPPHPLNRLKPATLTTSNRSICKRRRFLKPKQNKTAASAETGRNGLESRWSFAVVVNVLTVSIVEVVPGGVTVGGEKLHDAPAGNPDVQLKETEESKPLAGVIEIVVVPL